MSRVGKKPIPIPSGVNVAIKEGEVEISGPKGKLSLKIPSPIRVITEDGKIRVERSSDERKVRALHGLIRSLLNNMVIGLSLIHISEPTRPY